MKHLHALLAFFVFLFASLSLYAQTEVPADGQRVWEGAKLLKEIYPFMGEKVLSDADSVMLETGTKNCGFYQIHLDWKAEEIRQIEFTVKADKPGFFRFAFSSKIKGEDKRPPSNLKNLAIHPDGEYHTIVFDVSKDPRWNGTITNWELGWSGEAGATLGLKKVTISPRRNLIPDASCIDQSQPIVLTNLWPRTRCRLTWQGGPAPAMSLTGLDYNLRPLPGWEVVLSGQDSVEFTVPETLVEGVLSIAQPAEGFPVVEQLDEYRAPFTSQEKWRGQWIWSQQEWGPFDANVWFEKRFTLEELPKFATLSFLADDISYVYVNGRHVGGTQHFSVGGRAFITPYLRQGENRIAVRVYNGTQNAGLVVNGYIRLPNRELYVDSDSSWFCDPDSNLDNAIPQKIDHPVVELGDPNTTAPWASLINFRYAGPGGELNGNDFQPGLIQAEVKNLPPVTVSRLKFKLTADDGAVRTMDLAVTPDSSQWKVGEAIALHFPVPRWTGKDFTLTIDDDYVVLSGNDSVRIHTEPQPAPAIQQAHILHIGTRPTIQLGDELVNPTFWHLITAQERERMYECDFSTACGFTNFRLHADFLDFWRGDGEYDFSIFDEAMDRLFTANPHAALAVQVYAHMPDWWLKANPDSESVHYNGAPRQLDRDKQALGSKQWLRDAAVPIRALIDHLKASPYADRIWGMNFCENGNGEWFWMVNDMNKKPSCNGFSKSDYETFRMYLREKYGTDEALANAWRRSPQRDATLASAQMPDPATAENTSPYQGTLFDPVAKAQIIDWYIFRNRALAEAIISFGKVVKEATNGKWLTGAYYGYFTELAENGHWRLQMAGHNGFWEVAKSPYIDFVQAPSRYTYRKVGMSDQLMQPWNTFLLHGKTVFCEQDVRTVFTTSADNTNRIYLGIAASAADSVGQLNRGMGMALATGTNFYYFDISTGGLTEKLTHQVMQEQLKVLQELPSVQGLTPVEVAIVGDRDSAYLVKPAGPDGLFTGAISGLYPHFNELAAPYHSLVIGDLLDPAITVPPHKLYIMLPTLILSTEQRQALLQRFKTEKASVVWLHSAGPNYPAKFHSCVFNADFLGIETTDVEETLQPTINLTPEWGSLHGRNFNKTSPWFYPISGYQEVLGYDSNKQPVLVSKTLNGATHYLSTLTNLPTEFYGMLMDRLGIHRYAKGAKDPVWVGNDVLFLYANSSGEKQLLLPDGVRAKGIIGPFRGTLSTQEPFAAIAGQTYGFLLEKE